MRPAVVGVLLLTGLLSGCGAPRGPDDDFGPLPAFTLLERAGGSVRNEDLRGKVWVASFTFTHCAGACWQINETLSRLQRDFAAEPDFRLVTISVDPERDTPEVQRRYAEQRGADAGRWLFLSGNQDEIYRLIGKGFKLTVYQNEGPERRPGFEVEHTPRVAVVDKRGHVRGYFDGRQRDEQGNALDDYPALKARVAVLLAGGATNPESLAAVNASLNATCLCLLLAGYAAIRTRREALHKACMLSAVVVSAVFLACYLYLHIVVRQGKPTYFSDRHPDAAAWMGQLYLTILWTHIVLATVILPLALYTAYLGLRDRRPRHVRLARWTFPAWLYVSATGVVVYWMLYQM